MRKRNGIRKRLRAWAEKEAGMCWGIVVLSGGGGKTWRMRGKVLRRKIWGLFWRNLGWGGQDYRNDLDYTAWWDGEDLSIADSELWHRADRDVYGLSFIFRFSSFNLHKRVRADELNTRGMLPYHRLSFSACSFCPSCATLLVKTLDSFIMSVTSSNKTATLDYSCTQETLLQYTWTVCGLPEGASEGYIYVPDGRLPMKRVSLAENAHKRTPRRIMLDCIRTTKCFCVPISSWDGTEAFLIICYRITWTTEFAHHYHSRVACITNKYITVFLLDWACL